jgi:hypothetical protein
MVNFTSNLPSYAHRTRRGKRHRHCTQIAPAREEYQRDDREGQLLLFRGPFEHAVEFAPSHRRGMGNRHTGRCSRLAER